MAPVAQHYCLDSDGAGVSCGLAPEDPGLERWKFSCSENVSILRANNPTSKDLLPGMRQGAQTGLDAALPSQVAEQV